MPPTSSGTASSYDSAVGGRGSGFDLSDEIYFDSVSDVPDSGDGTMEATEESVGTWLTPVAIGVGVLAVAAAGLFAYSKMRR